MEAEKDFFGRGWGFPPEFTRDGNEALMLTGIEDIESSLHILLSTTVGERVMQPLYGCNLKKYLFEPMNHSMVHYIRKLVEDAILYFEARIRPEGVSVSVDDGRMDILVEYTVKATNSRYNFVYPFYLKEANRPV
jgi:uncharacterized protein